MLTVEKLATMFYNRSRSTNRAEPGDDANLRERHDTSYPCRDRGEIRRDHF